MEHSPVVRFSRSNEHSERKMDLCALLRREQLLTFTETERLVSGHSGRMLARTGLSPSSLCVGRL